MTVVAEDESTLQQHTKHFSDAQLGRVIPIALAQGFGAISVGGDGV